MKTKIRIIIISIIFISTIFTLDTKATDIQSMYTGLLKSFVLCASENSEGSEESIEIPEITIGEPVLEYQNMPLDVVQIITLPVTISNIQENKELQVKLVQDGIDLPETHYTISNNYITNEGNANIQISAGPEITLGAYTIVVEYTYGENSEKTQAEKNITITQLEMNQIIINQYSILIDTEESLQIPYTIVPNIFTASDVVFSSENENVATITENGEIIGRNRGETIITISSPDGRLQATCLVTVFDPIATITEITTTPEELKQGEEGQINVNVYIQDILNEESLYVQIYKNEVQLVTENFTIEGNLVQGNYVDLIITPKKDMVTSGEYKIHVTYEGKTIEDPTVQQTANFTVKSEVPVTTLEVLEERIYITTNTTKQINATISPNNASNKKLIWSSSDPEIATVNEQGVVQGISKGRTEITVYSDENPYLTSTIDVRVIDIVSTEEYTIDIANKIIKHIPVNTTVNSLLENLQIASDNYSVMNKNGETITGETLVGTDAQLKVNDEIFQIIISGDINGDGKLTSTDISKLALHIVKLQILTDGPLLGADLNKDDKISTTDISQMIKYIVKIYD